jgi:RNA polymerase sigma factor (sigma-70 family)
VEVSALKPSAVPALRGPSALLRLQSDERLVALVRRGQHDAFEALVSRYQGRLLAFCRHMLGSREDAEDVLQEVFAAAFNAILADERSINVRPWLYRIARNRSLNHLRRASAIGVDSMDVHYAENGLSTAEKVLRRESFRQLIGDVHRLPETQRTALLLREIDALSYEQIADAMETTVPAVKSLLVRARISLAEAAEARKLTCGEARLELGEAAEGLLKPSPAVRRHVRECERCRAFRKHLKDNNVALAAMLPVGPLLLLKKLALTKLGSTAGAGGAHVAGAGGAGVAGAGVAGGAGGASAGGLITAGASALATKAAAGLAVAALVTAGTVEAEHATSHGHRHRQAVTVASAATSPSETDTREPVVMRSSSQPVTAAVHSPSTHSSPSKKPSVAGKAKLVARRPGASADLPAEASKGITPAAATPAKPVNPVKPAAPPVTEVTTETTQLSGPSGSGGASSPTVTTTAASPTPTTTEAPPSSPPTTTTTATPPPAPPTTTTTEAPPPPPVAQEPSPSPSDAPDIAGSKEPTTEAPSPPPPTSSP